MEDIELVIKIPENTYRQIQALARNGYFEHDICGNSMRRIANGTPLYIPSVEAIECSKIDKAIEEIKELYTEWENSTDDARLESNPFGAVLNIIQRNIGE